jgi:FrmR/RcnR family transcriptional regulator, repressor of frmRAB operon
MCPMTHMVREKQKLLSRVKRIRGLVDAIGRAIENEDESDQVMHLIAGVRGAVAGLMAEVIEDHIRIHLLPESPDGQHGTKLESAEELFEVIRTYLR